MQRLFAHWNQDEEEEAGKILAELHGWAGVGRHLTVPWRVVIAGAPNVGKSSLINALAGYQRSIVTEIPGTTRDVVTALIAVDGWPVELADTAGMRKQADDLEQAGMELAQRAAIEADLCLWVLDATCEPTWPDIRVDQLRFVVNKIDLPAAWDTSQASGAIRVSARTEEGLLELCQAISQALVPESPAPGMAIPFTFELCAAVEQALPLQRAGKSNEARQVLKSAWTAVSPDKLMPAG